jgi:hypothetical protein
MPVKDLKRKNKPPMPDRTEENTRDIAVLKNDIEYIKRAVDRIEKQVGTDSVNYVTHQEFGPVKQIVYGIVSLILVSVFGGLLALIIRS